MRNDDGLMIPMNNIISVTERVAPKELNHFNKLRSASLTATIAPGYTLGDALAYLQETAARVLPATAQTDLGGQSREFKESATSLYITSCSRSRSSISCSRRSSRASSTR